MTNTEKLNQCFSSTFEISDVENMKFKETPLWDSVGHVALLSCIEDAFDILLEPEDMMLVKSYKNMKDILETKYDIKF